MDITESWCTDGRFVFGLDIFLESFSGLGKRRKNSVRRTRKVLFQTTIKSFNQVSAILGQESLRFFLKTFFSKSNPSPASLNLVWENRLFRRPLRWKIYRTSSSITAVSGHTVLRNPKKNKSPVKCRTLTTWQPSRWIRDQDYI